MALRAVVEDDERPADELPPDAQKLVAEWAAELRDRFLLCRDMGHQWRPRTANRLPTGGFERVRRCRQCSTERSEELDYRGHLVRSHYEYPDGYLAPKGAGRFDTDMRDTLRLESTIRLIPEENS